MKILIISPYRGIGDLIFHLPLIRYLNKKFKSKINLIVNPNTKAKLILNNERSISKISYANFNRQQQIIKIIDLTKKINQFKSDLAVLTAPSKRLKASVLLSNSNNKIYFSKNKEIDLAKYIFRETKKKFNITKFDRNYKLNSNFYKKKNIKKNIFISVDSNHNQNNWGEENYLNLIDKLQYKKYKIFINFSPKNKKKFKIVINKFKNKFNIVFTYKKKFTDILKIINKCDYIIGNESGPVCIAASLNKKVLSIYNPSTTPQSSRTINKSVNYINSKKINPKSALNKIIKFIK